MIFFLAIIFGLILNLFFGGFGFSTALCFLVGLFLIMPILLRINLKEVKEIKKYKKVFLIDFLFNFILSPIIALIIGYFVFGSSNYEFTIILILLALIPGGGLLMSWLEQSKADLHIGFILFSFNLFIFSIIYIIFNFGVENFIELMNKKNELFNLGILQNGFSLGGNIQAGCGIEKVGEKIGLIVPSCFEGKSTILYGFYGFLALILIPFIVSRIILLFPNSKKIISLTKKISKLSAFILISYIFSLGYIRELFSVDFQFILKITIGILLYYFIFYMLLRFTLNKTNIKTKIKKSLLWNSYTRFLTLSLILSFLYAIAWENPRIIIIPIIAYFVQIISNSIIIKLKNIDD